MLLGVLAVDWVAGAMSMPTTILSFLAPVNNDGSSLTERVETWPGSVTIPGRMANVLPCDELRTSRLSSTSGPSCLERRTRGKSFNGFIGPPWPDTDLSRDESAAWKGIPLGL